jgi:hypothetical protein
MYILKQGNNMEWLASGYVTNVILIIWFAIWLGSPW